MSDPISGRIVKGDGDRKYRAFVRSYRTPIRNKQKWAVFVEVYGSQMGVTTTGWRHYAKAIRRYRSEERAVKAANLYLDRLETWSSPQKYV